MKNIRFILYFGVLVACFYSCSTDVDIYAEYKDVPIIYAMLDAQADTKICENHTGFLRPIPTLKAAMGFFLHEPPSKRKFAFPMGRS